MTYNTKRSLVTAIAVTRNWPELTPGSAIRSVAAFTVAASGTDEASFSLYHEAYPQEASRADILRQLCTHIPQGATVLIELPEIPPAYLETGILPPVDAQLIQRERPDINLVPIVGGEKLLHATAHATGMMLAPNDAPLIDRARTAPVRAQMLWRAYRETACNADDHHGLIAAWQAWCAIERARPLGF